MSQGKFLQWHITKKHNINSQQYYDLTKKENEGKCNTCTKQTRFICFSIGYLEFCSQKCAGNNKEIQQKIKDVKKEKYGDENFTNRKKNKKTLREKYGVENVSQLQFVKNKKIQTVLKNYGVENQNQSIIVREKTKKTKKERYGDEKYNNREKAKKTMLFKYGTESFAPSELNRQLQEASNKWIALTDLSEYKKYCRKVIDITRKNVKKLFENWDGNCYYTKEVLLEKNSSNYNEYNYPAVDHKVSIFNGFKNNIEPNLIGDISNLCICSRKINSIKGLMNEEDFIKKLNK